MKLVRRVDPDRFDPNGPGGDGLFGLPYAPEESSLVIVPVPWEATTSYSHGTADGPAAIRRASAQLDLFDLELAELGLGAPWRYGIALEDIDPSLASWNRQAFELARRTRDSGDTATAEGVNRFSEQLDEWVYAKIRAYRQEGRLVALLGGEHSIPLGAIRALAEEIPGLGVLQIDAHADLRVAYEGFTRSHASIMYNVLEETAISTLVSVGIRDLCEEEYRRATANPKVHAFYDSWLHRKAFEGTTWAQVCREILGPLPQDVYISFDIDGLDPALGPTTGTPVPGGLSFPQASYLLLQVIASGRRVVGFDLNEVGGQEWDANVGARVLYRLCGVALHSAGARD